jgi:hypothetical protein
MTCVHDGDACLSNHQLYAVSACFFITVYASPCLLILTSVKKDEDLDPESNTLADLAAVKAPGSKRREGEVKPGNEFSKKDEDGNKDKEEDKECNFQGIIYGYNSSLAHCVWQ